MTCTVNGVLERFPGDGLSVRELLKAKGWSFPLIIVTLNGRLVAREGWDSTMVAEGDSMDAAHLMSGG